MTTLNLQDTPNLHDWIKKLIEQKEPVKEQVKVHDKNCMETHTDLLHLEADFQKNLHYWQDEMSLDVSQIVGLKGHVDTLYDLFQTFHIPLYKDQSQPPTFHVETTLSILQNLLSKYETVMHSLTIARDTINNLDSRQIITNQKISQWSSDTCKKLHETRASLMKQHQLEHHLKSEREILKTRLNQSERDRISYEQLVLSVVEKLNQAEETILVQQQQIKKWEAKVGGLKSQVDQLTKWKQHINGSGVVQDLQKKSTSSQSRERAIEYSERHRARQKVATPTRSRSTSRKRTNSQHKIANRPSDTELIAELLRATKIKKEKEYQPMYPAQQILFSKLKNIDGEINQLARDVLLYQ